MKRVITILLVITAVLLFGCSESGNDGDDVATDGTLTVTYEGDGTHNGVDIYAAVFAEGDVPGTDDPLALNIAEISGGSASLTLEELTDSGPSGTDWTGTANTTYDVYVFIDVDDTNEPSSGDMVYKTFDPSVQYVQDGDMTISTALSDYDGI